MKGVLMKAGQLISFIFEALPDEAQEALATLQADAAPMAPTLAAERGEGRARACARAGVPRVGRHAGRRRVDRPGAPRRHPRRSRRGGQGAVPRRAGRDRERPRRRRGDVRHVLGDDAQGPRRQGPRRRAPRPDARGARLPARGAQHHRVRASLPRSSVGADPQAGAGVLDRAPADHRVDRRAELRRVPPERVVRDQAARRRGRSGASPRTPIFRLRRLQRRSRIPATTSSTTTAACRSSTSASSSAGRRASGRACVRRWTRSSSTAIPELLVRRDGGVRLPAARPRPRSGASSTTTCRARTRRTSPTSSRSPASGCATRSA